MYNACFRAKVAQPEDIVTYGTVKVSKIYSNVLNKKEKEPDLCDAMKEVVPERWGEDAQITLNKDARDTRTLVTRNTLGSCGLVTSREDY